MTARSPAGPVRVLHLEGGRRAPRTDEVVTEEPMEVRACGPGQEPAAVSVTMRTPGNDFELAAGLLFSEGIVARREDIVSIRYCDLPPGDPQMYNVVTVSLSRRLHASDLRRRFVSSSSCGVCGTATLEDLAVRVEPLAEELPLAASTILGLPESLMGSQPVFARTGGLHGAGLYRGDGCQVATREDVGRHNALDKLIGRSLLAGELPLGGHAVALSGRIGFELVQKCALAGIPVIAAVSAPSSLAIATAERLGIALVGFVRGGSANVYTHPERVDMSAIA